MEMQFKNEIKKLADIVVWADNGIEEMRMDLSSLTEEEFKNLDAVKDLEAVKKVVLESIDRHKVYTSALNNDLADKDAKIEKLEKEIEGRKEGYTALKELMDTKYISIDEHKKEIEEITKSRDIWFETAGTHSATIIHDSEEINKLKEEIKKLNKCIMNKNETVNTANDAIVNLRKKISAHEEENARLSEKIMKLNGEVNKLNRFLKMQEDLTRDWKNKYVEAQKEIDEWESDTGEHETIVQYQEFIDGLNKDLSYWKGAFETQATSLAEVRKCNDDLVDTLNKSSDMVEELEKQVKYLKKELEQTCTTKELDLKGHNRREMALVNDLADKNDKIKKLEESIDYYKNQERIRTDQLRATESKVDELLGLVNELKKEKKEGDDYAREGFKLYVKNALIEAKGDKNEANEVITEAVRSAYAEWGKTQKENEKTIKKAIKEVMNKKFGYAWETAVRLRSEVDKKRIVDISEGAEKILGVSRDLFDAAIKALVDDGYQEIIGRIPQATNSYVYMDMHVLATPDVETKETANAENIKSLDFDIPCGEDAIE